MLHDAVCTLREQLCDLQRALVAASRQSCTHVLFLGSSVLAFLVWRASINDLVGGFQHALTSHALQTAEVLEHEREHRLGDHIGFKHPLEDPQLLDFLELPWLLALRRGLVALLPLLQVVLGGLDHLGRVVRLAAGFRLRSVLGLRASSALRRLLRCCASALLAHDIHRLGLAIVTELDVVDVLGGLETHAEARGLGGDHWRELDRLGLDVLRLLLLAALLLRRLRGAHGGLSCCSWSIPRDQMPLRVASRMDWMEAKVNLSGYTDLDDLCR